MSKTSVLVFDYFTRVKYGLTKLLIGFRGKRNNTAIALDMICFVLTQNGAGFHLFSVVRPENESTIFA